MYSFCGLCAVAKYVGFVSHYTSSSVLLCRHGEAHVTNKCPVYTTAYNVTHQEGIDIDHPRPPIPPPPLNNTPGIYDSIDHLAPMEKMDLRERIAMARPPLPPGNPPEESLSITSCNAYDAEDNTGSSSA